MPEQTWIRWRDLHVVVDGTPDLWRHLDGARDPIRLDRFAIVEPQPGEPDWRLRHDRASREPEVLFDGTEVVVRGPASYWAARERLGCVLLQAFDRELLRRGQLVLHGAAVRVGAGARVLTGPSDSGKTSLAVQLCREHGAALIANDHVLIDLSGERPVVLAAQDHVLALRSQAVWLNDRDGYARLFGAADRPEPYRRQRVQPGELGISVDTSDVPLHGIDFVGIGTVRGGARYPTPRLRALVKLHADITSRVRASDLLLFGDDGDFGPPLPDLSAGPVGEIAMRLAQRLVDSGLVHDVRGEPDWAAAALAGAEAPR